DTLRREDQLGHRNRRLRPPYTVGPNPDCRRHEDLSRHQWGNELVFSFLQPRHQALLCDGSRKLQSVFRKAGIIHKGSDVLRHGHEASAGRARAENSAGSLRARWKAGLALSPGWTGGVLGRDTRHRERTTVSW